MGHSWLNRLVPVLLFVPGLAMTSAPAAHAASAPAACDPVEIHASVLLGIEVVTFNVRNCTLIPQIVIVSGKRIAPANCRHSSLNFGDSPAVTVPALQLVMVLHKVTAPTCTGTYTVRGDTERIGTEIVLDADVTTYRV